MNRQEMEAIVAGVPTKSEKIRLLHRAGVAKADIARFLDIRYQHVYNVLLREKKPTAQGQPADEQTEQQVFQVKLGTGLKMTLPPEFAESEGLEAGDVVICRRDPDGLKIMSSAAAADYLRTVLRQRLPEQADMLEALLNAKGRFRSN